MNLYLISQTENDHYDTFDSAVVVAKSVKEARNINPECLWDLEYSLFVEWEAARYWNAWCSKPEHVKVEYLGKAAAKFKKPGVLLASFNAG